MMQSTNCDSYELAAHCSCHYSPSINRDGDASSESGPWQPSDQNQSSSAYKGRERRSTAAFTSARANGPIQTTEPITCLFCFEQSEAYPSRSSRGRILSFSFLQWVPLHSRLLRRFCSRRR